LVESSWTPFVVPLRVFACSGLCCWRVRAFEGGHEFKPAPEALACFVSVFAGSVNRVWVGVEFEVEAVCLVALVAGLGGRGGPRLDPERARTQSRRSRIQAVLRCGSQAVAVASAHLDRERDPMVAGRQRRELCEE
jgi:hypothetical protein